MADDAEVFYDPDGGYTVRLNLGLEAAESLLSALAGYDEFIADKVDYARQYPGEYSTEDVARMVRLAQDANALYATLVPVYSEAVATSIYGPDDES